MGTKDNEGDNPTSDERLQMSVDEYVLDIMRLEYADKPNTMSFTPDKFNQSYKMIQSACDSSLTIDCSGSPGVRTLDIVLRTYLRMNWLRPLAVFLSLA